MTTLSPFPKQNNQYTALVAEWLNRLRIFVTEIKDEQDTNTQKLDVPVRVLGYAKASLPTASSYSDGTNYSSLVFVNDEIGGATLAFSDGTNWRRVQDRAVVS